MKKNRIAVAATLGLLIAILGLIFLLRALEPAYQGRRISSWTLDLDGYAGPKMDGAKAAIRHIGVDAVPCVLGLLSTRDTPLKTKLNKWLSKQGWIKFRFTPAEVQWKRGLFACEALGTNARPAIPRLTELLYQPKFSRHAAYVLTVFGPDATPILTNAAVHSDATIRFGALISMTLLNDPSIVPFLLERRKDPDGEVRTAATEVLAFTAKDPDVVIPALIEGLQDSWTHVRSAAAYGLQHWVQYPQAKAAIPYLVQALRDAEKAPPIDFLSATVRKNATATLQKLDPEFVLE